MNKNKNNRIIAVSIIGVVIVLGLLLIVGIKALKSNVDSDATIEELLE